MELKNISHFRPNKKTNRKVTPYSVFKNRRRFLLASAMGLITLVSSKFSAFAKNALSFNISKKYQGKNLKVSDENLFKSYNNFYEYSFDKGDIKDLAQSLKTENWEVEVGGLVSNKLKLSIDDLLSLSNLESRVYRLRCVETWSAVVPWVGYPLAELIKKVGPLKEAKYVRFESHFDKDMPNISSTPNYPWPYSEGLRLDEAKHDLTLLTFGAYGKALSKQNGAPVRLVVPWKYGFKSLKSIKKIEFVADQPKTMWNELAPNEYGFYANVNPKVDHPRWSQKYEKQLGSLFKREETLFLNGYDKEVKMLYAGMDLTRFF